MSILFSSLFNFYYTSRFLCFREGQLPGGDTLCYKFNMAALTNYLKEQSEKNVAAYYNIDIIKYQVLIVFARDEGTRLIFSVIVDFSLPIR